MPQPPRFIDENDEPIKPARTEPTPYIPRGTGAITAEELEKQVAELEASRRAALENSEIDMTAKIAEWQMRREQLIKEIEEAEAAAEKQHMLYIRTRDVIQALPANKREESLIEQAAKLRDAAYKKARELLQERESIERLIDIETKRMNKELPTDVDDFGNSLQPSKTASTVSTPKSSVQAMWDAERAAVEARNRAAGVPNNVEADLTAAVRAAGVTVIPPTTERNTPSNIDRRSEREQTPAELCLRAIQRYNACGLTAWADQIQEQLLPHLNTLNNEQQTMIARERANGKIMVFMPSAELQLAHFDRAVQNLKRSVAGNTAIYWNRWTTWIQNREHLLVDGAPDRAHVSFIDGGERPNPRTTGKTVSQQREELAQINRELGQQSLPAVDSVNSLEYLALQTEVDSPVDVQTYTRFIKLVAAGYVANAIWRGDLVKLNNDNAGLPHSTGGFRLARRVTF